MNYFRIFLNAQCLWFVFEFVVIFNAFLFRSVVNLFRSFLCSKRFAFCFIYLVCGILWLVPRVLCLICFPLLLFGVFDLSISTRPHVAPTFCFHLHVLLIFIGFFIAVGASRCQLFLTCSQSFVCSQLLFKHSKGFCDGAFQGKI